MKALSRLLVALGLLAILASTAPAQEENSLCPPDVTLRTPEELDQMFAPVALYPDPLLAEMLPAATFPAQVVLASRYVTSGGDHEQVDQQPWDASVQAVARYPDVIRWMDENLSWTVAIGQAFLWQPREVMASIQRLRDRAQTLGLLQNTPEASVVVENGLIEIFPADPESVYIPSYASEVIVIHASTAPRQVTWRRSFRTGAWLANDFDWPNQRVMCWPKAHPRPVGWWSSKPSERRCPEGVRIVDWHRAHRHATQARLATPHDSLPVKASAMGDAPQSSVTVIGSRGGTGSGSSRGGNVAGIHGSGRSGGSTGGSSQSGSAGRSTSTQHPNAPASPAGGH